jgi:RNA polymerase sigma-70 factor (ECF subfamily)
MAARVRSSLQNPERITFLRGPAGERALVARLQAGDDLAFRECYEQHAPALMRVLLRLLGDRSLAEDVLQETFVAAFDAVGSFRADARLSTWLTSIALRRALNLRRGEARRQKNLPNPEDERPVSPARHFVGRALTERVMALLDELESPKKLVLLLRAEGHSAADIAELMQEPRGTVLSRLSRARAELAEKLARAGLGSLQSLFEEEHGT